MDKESKIAFRRKVGRIVERLRLEKGLTQGRLGEELGYKDNSAAQIVSRFESGRAGIPKAKIEKLIEILGMKNRDFGLDATNSLRNFISLGGFLGSPAIPFGNAIVEFMEAGEAEVVKQAISDDQGAVEESEGKSDGYANLIRLMALYRIQKRKVRYSLIETLDILDSLCDDDRKFTEVLTILEVDPKRAYGEIEKRLMAMLSQRKADRK